MQLTRKLATLPMPRFAIALLILVGAFIQGGCAGDSAGSLQPSQAVAGEATPAPERPGGARSGWAW
ncbi:MAG: hypothetical protein ABI871_00825 [Chthoniobacterales bacterium]